MIVNFKDIEFDQYGNIEPPTLLLKYLNGNIQSTIGLFYDFHVTFRFNDVSEISFKVPAYNDGFEVPYYQELTGYKIITFEPFGDFIIVSPKKINDGIKEYKEIQAYSLEYVLNYKQMILPKGTYNFYSPVEGQDTIMSIILEPIPDWSIGSVDKRLWGKWRTFDNINDKLYPFIMSTIQKVYNCLFLFDTKKKEISVISADSINENSPIFMSFDNLIKSIQIDELSEEVTTVLSGYGSNDMSIASVNPNGTDKIYNLDWLIATGNISESLATRWNEYQLSLNYYQKVFSDLNTLYSEKILYQQLLNANLMIAKTDVDALEAALITAKADTTLTDWQTVIKRYETELKEAKAKYDDYDLKVKDCEKDVVVLKDQIKEVLGFCKLDSFFTKEELVELSMYFKEDSLVESSFVVPEFNSTINDSEQSTITNESNAVLKIEGMRQEYDNEGEFTSKDIFYTNDLGEYVPLNEDGDINLVPETNIDLDIKIDKDIANTVTDKLNKDVKRGSYKLCGGKLTYSYKYQKIINGKKELRKASIEGELFNASLIYNKTNLRKLEHNDTAGPLTEIEKQGYFIFTALLKKATFKEVDRFDREVKNTQFPSANISLQGMLKPIKGIPGADRLPNINSEGIGFEIESGTFYNTASVTYSQKQSVYQELYDYVKDALKKVSEPSYQFDIDSANYIFDENFIAFTKHTALGNTINLDIDGREDSAIIKPILIELSLNYDDPSDFKITFSNKFKASNPEFLLADIIGESVRSTKTFELNKSSYSSYIDSGADRAVNDTLNSEYDIARHAIVNSENQGIEWNNKGLFLRKKDAADYYNPEQIAMINNMIAFTNDSWNTVELAIGKFKDKNAGEVWGIAAPNIKGTLFAGENLIIENRITNEDGTKVNKEFKVDKTGAWLKNSALYFGTDEGNSGKMLLDPRYGFAAGNKDLYSETNGVNTIPSFIDEKGDIIFEDIIVKDQIKGRIPKNSSFYFDSNKGKAYFKGDIYATDGYFAGVINASRIEAGTLEVDGKIITGQIDAGPMSQNVIDAINSYLGTMQQGNPENPPKYIDGEVIDHLDAGKITTGELSADVISANVIDAINGSFGRIRADKIDAALLTARDVLVMNDNAKIMINPNFGIVAGNKDLFDIDEDGNIINTTFIHNGTLQFDEGASAPKNTSFFFDINTGKAYFSGDISASDIKVGKLNPDRIDISNAFITDAWVKDLNANKITAGSINADVIKSTIVNSQQNKTEISIGGQLYFKHGTIQDALIGNLSADKITAGTIDTNRVKVSSQDGGFLINGNVTQWTDNIGNIRLQAGQDKNGKFNFAVFGEDGKTTYFDEGGIHADGIRDNILVDNMFKPIGNGYEGISGNKVNIDSIIKKYNSDGSVDINSGKIVFNDDPKPIYKKEIGDDGNPVKVKPKTTYYDYVLDVNGNKQYDENGIPLLIKKEKDNEGEEEVFKYVQKVDSEGKPVFDIALDDTGNPIYLSKKDIDGSEITDKDGNILLEEEPLKYPVYEQEYTEEINPDGTIEKIPVFDSGEISLDVFIRNLQHDYKDSITDIKINSQGILAQVSQVMGKTADLDDKINREVENLSSQIEVGVKGIRAEFKDSYLYRYISFNKQGLIFGDSKGINQNIPLVKLGTFPLAPKKKDENNPTTEVSPEEIPEEERCDAKLILCNTQGTPLTWLTETTLMVKDGRIRNRLHLGDFAFIPRVNDDQSKYAGNLSFVKITKNENK